MNYLILFLLTSLMLYVILKKRRFDYFTVLSISSLLYYYPSILGEIRAVDTNLNEKIIVKVYLCIALFLGSLFIYIFLNDKYIFKFKNRIIFKRAENKSLNDIDLISNITVLILSLICLVLLFKVRSKYNILFGNYNKAVLLSNEDKLISYFKYFSMFIFIYSYTNRGKFINILKILSLVVILYTFYLGHRSFIVLGIIGILLLNNGNKNIRLSNFIIKHWKLSILLLMIGLFFVFVKGLFAAFMNGQYDIVKSRLTDIEYYKNSLLLSESNTIIYNLQRACGNDMIFSICDYLYGFISLIPLWGNTIIQNSSAIFFETELNSRFNPGFKDGYGLASTFLGESYAAGGFLTLLILSILLFIFIKYLNNKLYNCNDKLIATFISSTMPYLTFFIHRNSLIYVLITMRSYLYILLLSMAIRKLIKSIIKI